MEALAPAGFEPVTFYFFASKKIFFPLIQQTNKSKTNIQKVWTFLIKYKKQWVCKQRLKQIVVVFLFLSTQVFFLFFARKIYTLCSEGSWDPNVHQAENNNIVPS